MTRGRPHVAWLAAALFCPTAAALPAAFCSPILPDSRRLPPVLQDCALRFLGDLEEDCPRPRLVGIGRGLEEGSNMRSIRTRNWFLRRIVLGFAVAAFV